MQHGMSNLWYRLRKLELENLFGICSFCPFHGGENKRRWVKHGVKKPRYKDIDRTTIRRDGLQIT